MKTFFLCCVLPVLTIGVKGQVSNQELRDVSNQLWQADANRIDDVDYNEGGSRLFNYVDESRLNELTFKRIQLLREYFIPLIGQADPVCTGSCQSNQDLFLNELMASEPIKIVQTFLASKGLASADYNGFRNEIRQYLFTRYSRSGGTLDSSGFEHIMFGEVRSSGVTGFHGWVQAYLLEKENAFRMTNYQATCDPDVARLSFTWTYGGTSYRKSVTSVSIGSTPEAEIALFILCFQARPNGSCSVNLNGALNTVTTYSMNGVSPRTFGTAYIAC